MLPTHASDGRTDCSCNEDILRSKLSHSCHWRHGPPQSFCLLLSRPWPKLIPFLLSHPPTPRPTTLTFGDNAEVFYVGEDLKKKILIETQIRESSLDELFATSSGFRHQIDIALKIVPHALFVYLGNPIQRSIISRPFVGSRSVRKIARRFQIGSTIFNRFCIIPTLSKMSTTQSDL